MKIHFEINFETDEPHWVKITPEYAAQLLEEFNTRNRRIKPSTVRKLANELKNGEWRRTTACMGFRFCGEGDRQVLSNAQHRLAACVESGVAFETICVCRLPETSFEKEDLVIGRSLADGLEIKGHAYASSLASALKNFDTYAPLSLGGRGGSTRNLKLTTGQLQAIFEQHPGIARSVAIACKWRAKILRPGLVAAIHYVCTLIDKEKADVFFTRVANGEMLSPRSPELCLHRMLQEDMINTRKRFKDRHKAALMLLAFNHFRNGKNVSLLKWSDEMSEFPTP